MSGAPGRHPAGVGADAARTMCTVQLRQSGSAVASGELSIRTHPPIEVGQSLVVVLLDAAAGAGGGRGGGRAV